MVENTHLKELSAKIETVMVVLDQKEKKDQANDECMSLIEQSLTSIAKYMESLQLQHSVSSSS